MPLLNPSFEDAGALPGEAAHWTMTAVTSLEVLAGFGAAPEEAWEDFERWFARLAALDDVTVALAFFDSVAEGYEDFGEGWANAVYLHELPPAQRVTCPFGGGAVEDCEAGWRTVPYLRDWALVTAEPGVFDGEPQEGFEDQWRSNESYARTWADITSSGARFDGAAQSAEDFDNAWVHATTQ